LEETMRIEVLGTGCMKCRKQYEEVMAAIQTTGVVAEVVKVEKIDEIMKRGVMLTPSLLIDGKIVSSGKVLSARDCAKLLTVAGSRGTHA